MIKIWGTSFSLIGDLIMSLPQLVYFKKKYKNSYINFVIHKKISYCAPLFLTILILIKYLFLENGALSTLMILKLHQNVMLLQLN